MTQVFSARVGSLCVEYSIWFKFSFDQRGRQMKATLEHFEKDKTNKYPQPIPLFSSSSFRNDENRSSNFRTIRAVALDFSRPPKDALSRLTLLSAPINVLFNIW